MVITMKMAIVRVAVIVNLSKSALGKKSGCVKKKNATITGHQLGSVYLKKTRSDRSHDDHENQLTLMWLPL